MSGIGLIIIFILSIIVMIVAISKWKIHPFIVIMTVSLILGLLSGIPLVTQTGEGGEKILGITEVIGKGFSGTFKSIGIVIILGALIGTILEATGAAFRLADIVIRIVGNKNPELAILMMGWIVSIPVFCDSGFVILNPIRKALVKKTKVSSVGMSVALSCGLYISHVFIPPTPGPIAAANTLGIGNHLLLVIGIGVLVSIVPLIVGFFYAHYIGKKVRVDEDKDLESDTTSATYEELVASYKNMPGSLNTLAPIIVPIILMTIGSISGIFKLGGFLGELAIFIGHPIMALSTGVVCGVIQLSTSKNMDKFYDITNETLKTVGPILFITAAGGVLGSVIASSGLVGYITQHANVLNTIGIFFPFVLAAILKTAQGSSTVALTTTAGILAPLMGVLGLDTPILSALTVIAIGAGAMTVSHANDSYFWVVTNFGKMTPDQGYKTQTVATFLLGISSIIWIFVISLVLKAFL